MEVKQVLRGEFDALGDSEAGLLRGTRLMRVFYDGRVDVARGTYLLRRLTMGKAMVDEWLETEETLGWVLTKLAAVFLKSVGTSSEYPRYRGRVDSSEFNMLMVEFMSQHKSILYHLVPPPHNLYTTLANLTLNAVSSFSISLIRLTRYSN
jgi:hypothetical protein